MPLYGSAQDTSQGRITEVTHLPRQDHLPIIQELQDNAFRTAVAPGKISLRVPVEYTKLRSSDGVLINCDVYLARVALEAAAGAETDWLTCDAGHYQRYNHETSRYPPQHRIKRC
jgi:hypothetical protein